MHFAPTAQRSFKAWGRRSRIRRHEKRNRAESGHLFLGTSSFDECVEVTRTFSALSNTNRFRGAIPQADMRQGHWR
jgi:hypothetical protein